MAAGCLITAAPRISRLYGLRSEFADLSDGRSDREAFVFAITRGEGNTEGNNEGDIEGDIGLGIKRNQIRSRT